VFDLFVRGGVVLDGTGGPGRPADIAVTDGRIAAVLPRSAADSPVSAPVAAEVIDAAGRYVTPGFVDTHVHADAAALRPDVQLAALRQGVTTVLLGQDGLSFAPGSPSTVDFVNRYFAAVNGTHPGLDGWTSVAGLLAGYTGRTALNTAYLVPHGTVRYEVMGAVDRAATPDELARMRRLIEDGLADGAVGLSTGLEYAPGRYADTAELVALSATLGGRPYVTHMRGYGTNAARGLAEAITVGLDAGVPVHVSHLHGDGAQLTDLLDRYRADGVDLTFDSYPYLRGSSTLALVTLPAELPTADLAATAAALRDRATVARLRGEWPERLWPCITLSYVDDPEWVWAEGLTIPEAAARADLEPAELAVRLLLATDLRAGCVFDNNRGGGAQRTEDSLRLLLRHPAQMGGSDGIYQGSRPHPRGYGAFARLLGRHVRQLGDWTWPEAVHHLAGRPAERFDLADRGLIAPGHAADLVVLDPATIADRATYPLPRVPAAGVSTVVVNGIVVLRDGALTGAMPGRGLRCSQGVT
jgi:N-acyl-D-amino-acid deacylase